MGGLGLLWRRAHRILFLCPAACMTHLSPASAAHLLNVRSTTRFGWLATQPSLDGSSENSTYASSSTTSTGRRSTSSSSCVPRMLPSGLLGEVRNSSLGLCATTACLMPAAAWAHWSGLSGAVRAAVQSHGHAVAGHVRSSTYCVGAAWV